MTLLKVTELRKSQGQDLNPGQPDEVHVTSSCLVSFWTRASRHLCRFCLVSTFFLRSQLVTLGFSYSLHVGKHPALSQVCKLGGVSFPAPPGCSVVARSSCQCSGSLLSWDTLPARLLMSGSGRTGHQAMRQAVLGASGILHGGGSLLPEPCWSDPPNVS